MTGESVDNRGGTHQAPVTVVVISHNRAEELVRTLGRLRALPESPPVIVVDNGSDDGTSERLCAQFPEVTLIALPRNRGAFGRNLGVALATTPFVAFCDDDTWWSPGSLTRAAQILASCPRLAVATARIIVEPAGVVDAICEEMARSPLPRVPGVPGAPLLSFLAGASVLRRDAFIATGGFSMRFLIGGEEELLGADLTDAGWALAYFPELEIHHQASTLRDADLRRRQGIRNTLWFTWLRRPVPSAWRRTRAMLGAVPRDRTSLGALLDVVRGVPFVVAQRRRVGDDVEAGLRLLDIDQMQSEARRYVS